MSLLITTARESDSLWQAVCETHGLLCRAVISRRALLAGRLHDFEHPDCTVHIGGLRCMFCYQMVEVDRWLADVQICCQPCMQRILVEPRIALIPLDLDEIPLTALV